MLLHIDLFCKDIYKLDHVVLLLLHFVKKFLKTIRLQIIVVNENSCLHNLIAN